MEVVNENRAIIYEVEEKEGKSWVRKVYERNGLRYPERRGNG